jgi:CheY-like chemotaxis protein
MLALEGYRIMVAPDCATELQIAPSELPALLLCDIIMPGMAVR